MENAEISFKMKIQFMKAIKNRLSCRFGIFCFNELPKFVFYCLEDQMG